MPATRITLALNTNQTQKTPLLPPAAASHDPTSPNSCRALVIKAAQSKLRLKKPSRVFVAGAGKELRDSQDWKGALRDDVTLLVSAGEEYVGLRKDGGEATEASAAKQGNPDCPVALLAHKTPVDALSVTQLETTARTLPGLIRAVGQPDLHPGTKFPIGSVFVSEGWVHPPLIGGDIGCGMAWYKTRLSRSQVDGDKGRRVAEKLRGLEGAWRSQAERMVWLTEEGGKCCSVGEEWDGALGTIGAGNHFAEVQVVEACEKRGEEEKGLAEDEVVLLVHSGSRGYGGDVLKRFTTESRISLHEDDPRTKEYLEEHDRACEWARCNRDLIALRFLACLEPGDEAWQLGRNEDSGAAAPVEAIQEAKAKLQERKVVDIWHNNVERISWPPQPPSTSNSQPENLVNVTASLSITSAPPPAQQTHAYIHRKGAAPTYDPRTATPLPLLPLPGSRGTPTLILHPTFSATTSWGAYNALSRQKALTSLSQKYKNPETLLQPGTESQQQSSKAGSSGEEVRGGTWVVCDERQLVWEEAPEAYKDVFAVAQDLVEEGCAVVRGWCRPRVSYKVRNEGRG